MLDCSVDVKHLSNVRRTYEPAQIKPQAPAGSKTQAQVALPALEDGVTLSAPPPAVHEVSSPPTATAVRFKTLDGPSSGAAVFTEGSHPAGYSNAPLLQGMPMVPVYTDELKPIEGRYPGVAQKLGQFEVEAARKGYCPVQSKQVEQSVISSPPWPQTDFGDPRVNIGAKAKELQRLHPELNTADSSAYDFKKANREAAQLLETLDEMFPKDKFPGIVKGARAKAPQSLAKKMEKQTGFDPNFTLAHLTDTVGARIDSPDLKTLGEVAKGLESKYKDKIVAKSDYVSTPGDNGYRALHYIVDINGRMVEIQASTTSLRAADLATHDTVYKPEFPVSPETAKELSTAADRIMFLECLKLKESG